MSGAGSLDDVASRALASILLEHTAECIEGGGVNAAAALVALERDSALVIDVCAGILCATSWLAGAAGLSAEEVFAAALAFKPDESEQIAFEVESDDAALAGDSFRLPLPDIDIDAIVATATAALAAVEDLDGDGPAQEGDDGR